MQIDGHNNLRLFLTRFNLLNEGEAEEFVGQFKQVAVKKRQYIVQPNFTAKSRHFVVKGAFRSFVVGDSGAEHTISFAIENWWITDYNSYIYQQPATMFVVALEDSILLQIDYEKESALKASNHKFETIFRVMAERGLAFQQRRMISNLTQTAEERYNFFMEKYPEVAQRLPQYALASYLGMTTEFLSRIRNQKVKKG
jgi:CRP-like cAMP-binding protein